MTVLVQRVTTSEFNSYVAEQSRAANHRLATTAARGRQCICHGYGAKRFWRRGTVSTFLDIAANRSGLGDNHPVYSLHCLVDGDVERTWDKGGAYCMAWDLDCRVSRRRLAVADTHMKAVEDRSRSGLRTCPGCHYQVVNPFTKRCPRCLTSLPEADSPCSSCHQSCGSLFSCSSADDAKST